MDNSFGGYVKPTPLFSFRTIIDQDVSLINLLVKKYNDTSVFNFKPLLEISYQRLISIIYYRPMENPLYPFLIDDSKEDFIDECYKEFLETKEKEILEEGVITEIPRLIKMFKDSAGINPSVFYYNDIELEAIKHIDLLEGIKTVKYKDIREDSFSQIYLKDCSEVENFPDIHNKTVYFASSAMNMAILDDDIRDHEFLLNLASNHNQIAVYDLYRNDLINRDVWRGTNVNKGDSNE